MNFAMQHSYAWHMKGKKNIRALCVFGRAAQIWYRIFAYLNYTLVIGYWNVLHGSDGNLSEGHAIVY